jgi:hypothetical protein
MKTHTFAPFMKYFLPLVTALFFCTQSAAFKPEDVEKLRDTGSCKNCDLSGFKFPEMANLVDADLEGANLSGAILTRANLTGAIPTGDGVLESYGLKRF